MAIDVVIVAWLNSWAGISEKLDIFIIFSAIFLWYWMMAAVLAFPVASLLPRYRLFLHRHVNLFVTALVSAFAARYAVTEIIRFFYNRPRPFEVAEQVVQLVGHAGGGSFPSGHASLAFAVATAVFFYYPKTGLIFFAAAILIGVSRVAAGVHWPSDILGGAIVGVASAWILHKTYQKWQQKRTGIRS